MRLWKRKKKHNLQTHWNLNLMLVYVILLQTGDLSNPELRIITSQLHKIVHRGKLLMVILCIFQSNLKICEKCWKENPYPEKNYWVNRTKYCLTRRIFVFRSFLHWVWIYYFDNFKYCFEHIAFSRNPAIFDCVRRTRTIHRVQHSGFNEGI